MWRNLLLALALSACHRPVYVTMPPGSVKAELVIDQPSCWMPERPVPPENPTWPTVEEDYYRRIYVNRRDYEELLQYLRDKQEYEDSLVTCMAKLANVVQ